MQHASPDEEKRVDMSLANHLKSLFRSSAFKAKPAGESPGRAIAGIAAFVLLLAMASIACAFLPDDSPTPEPTSEVTLPDNVLSYLVPLYSTTLEAGERVPGTQMSYIGRNGDAYEVSIDGLKVPKQVGDSFTWRGIVAAGVLARYNLRLSPTFVSDSLLVGGPVELFVFNPIAVELPNTDATSGAVLHYDNITIDFSVPKGSNIPGTTLVFEGQTDQGAQLSGTTQHPYRAQGDSLIWIGRLRGNVIIRYNLRTTAISDESLRLIGTADLWVTSVKP
jgi:hypothetical protein